MQVTERTIEKEYYKYLVSFIDGGKYKRYSRLLDYLYHTDYIWEYEMDENRAGDGLEFRNYFEMDFHVTDVRISGPCSMLEMMVGLAYRMERELMDDVAYGDRTSQWFWMMINSLGLGYMNNRISILIWLMKLSILSSITNIIQMVRADYLQLKIIHMIYVMKKYGLKWVGL